MKKNLQKNTYKQLVEDITELYDCARRALVEAYWQIGKRIVEQEQQGETNAIYGDHLLSRLSEDLMDKLCSGFSKRNLYNMRRFYLAHEEILQPPAKLTWTQHVELLPIKEFYLPGVSSYERIYSDGLYLNQELLDKGLAQPVY